MRITGVDTFVLHHTLTQPFSFAQGTYTSRDTMLVRLTTDDGLEGWGEAFGPATVNAEIVEAVYRPVLLGRDPLDREVLVHELYGRTRAYGQKGIMICAMSAIDIALWDLAGKSFEVPVSKLLGGTFRNRVPAYATGFYFREVEDQEKSLVEEAIGYKEAGFGAMKVKIGVTPSRDIALVRRIREAVGPNTILMVDANCGYTVPEAIEVGRALEECNLAWFEEPIPGDNIASMRELRGILSIPIASGESEFTRHGFLPLLMGRGVDIVQPSIASSGGLTECQHVAAMAQSFGVITIPHAWGSAITMAATLHFLASLPPTVFNIHSRVPLLEMDRTENPFREELTDTPIQQEGGWVRVPEGAGLGVVPDMTKLEKWLVRR